MTLITTLRPLALAGALVALALPLYAQDTPAIGPQVAEKAPSADKVAERMQRFYDKTADFQASFKQTYMDIAAGESKQSYGKVYIKKPGKMRWDYYKKSGEEQKLNTTLVSDGKILWNYEHEFKQVYKECLAGSKLPTSVTFLMGEGDLLKTFDASLDKASTSTQPVLKLTPKTPTSQYKELQFVVDGETYQVLKATVFDPYGNTNEIVFSKVKLDQELPDAGFSFEPPKDARLLNPQQDCP